MNGPMKNEKIGILNLVCTMLNVGTPLFIISNALRQVHVAWASHTFPEIVP
jgi:hypothetical protein